MDINNDMKKLEIFFEDNLRVKKLLNDMIPSEMDFYNDDSKNKYIDKLLVCLYDVERYVNRMLVNYNLPDRILIQFNDKIKQLQNRINSNMFLNQGYISALKFISDNLSDMRQEFIDSVQKGFIGYSNFYGYGVLNPITINEFLHYIHSYVINNEKFYSSIPVIRSIKDKDNWGGIYLRGMPNNLGNKLYEGILISDIQSQCINIINLDKKMLIMARDLGHAAVIEIELDKEKPYVKYYIPKNNNIEMTSILKGIKVNKEEFAIGGFQTTEENIVQDICSLMREIPTDRDRIESSLNF